MDSIVIDVEEQLTDVGAGGACWGAASDDLNCTLVAWNAGGGSPVHRNDELDVVTVVVRGAGVAFVDGLEHPLRPGVVLVIPRGAERSFTSSEQGLAYLNVHRKRLLPPKL